MKLNLRQAIVQRVVGMSQDELFELIEDSVQGDERTLPGLGVLFEMIWKNTEQATRQTLINTLEQQLATMAPKTNP